MASQTNAVVIEQKTTKYAIIQKKATKETNGKEKHPKNHIKTKTLDII